MDIDKLNNRLFELEKMDVSVKFKHLRRKDWPKDLLKNNILLWQVPPRTGEFLTLMSNLKKPKNILELGTSGGYSGLCLLKGSPNSILHTIEFSEYRFNIAKESFEIAQVSDSVVSYLGKIKPIIESWSESLDFLFIDADKPAYLENFKLLESHISSGGIVIVDNILDSLPKTQPFVDYVKTNKDFFSEVLDFDNGLLFAIKK